MSRSTKLTPRIAITATNPRAARRFCDSISRRGGEPILLIPETSIESNFWDKIQGLMLTDGEDVEPARYGETPSPEAGLVLSTSRDALDFHLLEQALRINMPVLAICRGMQVLNVAFGGRLIQDLPSHRTVQNDLRLESSYHSIHVHADTKLGKIINAEFFRYVNSRHHQGVAKNQVSPSLVASAFCPFDGLIEGLESPDHRWVLGVQCHPEREDEVPQNLLQLFDEFLRQAREYAGSKYIKEPSVQ